MSICSICDRPGAAEQVISIVDISKGESDERNKAWAVDLCPNCKGRIADEVTRTIGKEPEG